MSTQSHKSKWQMALAKSGLGHCAVGTGLAMSLYANADGTRMFPSMTALSEDMGCNRKYVTAGRDTLTEYGWLAFAAKAVPNRRGKEFLPTFGRRRVSLSGTHEAVAKGPSQDDRVSLLEPVSVPLEPVSVPLNNITMEERAPCSKTMEVQDHECTGLGRHAWCGVEARAIDDDGADARAKAALAEKMERAPDF